MTIAYMLLVTWLIIFIIRICYKLAYQYKNKNVGEQPYSYIKVKNFLKYLEIATLLITVSVLTSTNPWYLVLIPISFTVNYLVNFICFKRASDKLYSIYITGGMKPKDALETANSTINREIEKKERT